MAQMTIVDRNSIEDGLRRGLSIPEIAKLIGRPPQTVTNEIKSRRTDSTKGLKATNSTCRWYGECKRTQVCDTHCGMNKEFTNSTRRVYAPHNQLASDAPQVTRS